MKTLSVLLLACVTAGAQEKTVIHTPTMDYKCDSQSVCVPIVQEDSCNGQWLRNSAGWSFCSADGKCPEYQHLENISDQDPIHAVYMAPIPTCVPDLHPMTEAEWVDLTTTIGNLIAITAKQYEIDNDLVAQVKTLRHQLGQKRATKP